MEVMPYAAQKPQFQFALQQFPFFQFPFIQFPFVQFTFLQLRFAFLFRLFEQKQFFKQEQFILFQRPQPPFDFEQEQRAEIPVRLFCGGARQAESVQTGPATAATPAQPADRVYAQRHSCAEDDLRHPARLCLLPGFLDGYGYRDVLRKRILRRKRRAL